MQKKPFSAILHMSPRERMVTLVWTSCVLSGLLLVSVLFFVRPFPMFSQDSVAVLDATVADMNTQDKGRFVRIQVVPNPSDAGASSFIVPASGTRFFVGQKVQLVVDSGRRFPEQKGHVWEVRNMRGDPLVDSHDIGLHDRYVERLNRDILIGFIAVQFLCLLVMVHTWYRHYAKADPVR